MLNDISALNHSLPLFNEKYYLLKYTNFNANKMIF